MAQPDPTPPARINHPHECLTLTLGSSTITFRSTGTTTGGAWSLLEVCLPARQHLASAHRHTTTLEACFVLSGELTVHLNGAMERLKPGTLLVIPPGTHHAYSNESGTAATFLLHATPAGHEVYYEELAGLLARVPEGQTLTPEQDLVLQVYADPAGTPPLEG